MTALIRRPVLLGAGLAVIAALVLVALTLRSGYIQEGNVRVPAQAAVAVLRPGQQVCVTLARTPARGDAVGVWGGPVLPTARVSVTAANPSGGPVLATGAFVATAAREYVVALSRPIPPQRPVRLCIRAVFDSFSVLGTPPNPSLALFKRVSGFAGLNLDFSRAALFRPDWVGQWTFWMLASGLLATFGVAAVAVARAAREDEEAEEA